MWTTDRVAGGVLALFALVAIRESRRLPLGTLQEPGPGYVPLVLSLLLLAFAVGVAVAGRGEPLGVLRWTEGRHAAAILGLCFFSAFALERLGFRLTTLLALGFLLRVVERKGWATTAAFALGMAFGTVFLFHTVLRVPLPRGPFGL